jgi:iron complex transport system permease protein
LKETPLSTRRQTKPFFTLGQVILILILLNIVLFIVSLSLGRYKIDPLTVLKVVLGKIFPLGQTFDDTVKTVIFDIRFPRVIAALLIGASLSESGAAYQGIFDNPLVSPFILGLSSGAGFGAAIAILIGGNYLLIELFAFIFSIIAVVLSLFISRSQKNSNSITLVLSGFIVSSLFTSLISFLKYYADPYTKLPSIVYWLMGSLAQISQRDVIFVAPFIIASIILLYLLRWKLNILSLGNEEATLLGENPKKLRLIIIFLSTLLTSLCVSISGVIGWVGLVIPHLGRMLVGPDFRKLLPVSTLIGSFYLLLIDDLSRTISLSEIPIGILTALIGAPFFIYLMRRGKYRWS